MAVYTRVDGVGVWDSFRKTHRQGKIEDAGTRLTVLSEATADGINWLEIKEVKLDRVIDVGYPAFWVKKMDTLLVLPDDGEPELEPIPVGNVTEVDAALGLAVFLRWWKQ